MKIWGFCLLFVGLAVIIGSLCYQTTVDPAAPGLEALGSLNAKVYNLGRLQEQMMMFVAGNALSVVGAVFVAVGVAIERSLFAARSADNLSFDDAPVAPSFAAPTAPVREDGSWGIAAAGIGVLLAVLAGVAIMAFGSTGDQAPSYGQAGSTSSSSENTADELAARIEAQADNMTATDAH